MENSQSETFFEIVNTIKKKNPFQRKMIDKELLLRDDLFWARVAHFSEGMKSLISERKESIESIADCYNKLCKDMLLEQIKFRKTGKYSSSSFAEVDERVYSSRQEMEAMVYGLAVSQFLWRNHYLLFDFFIESIEHLSESNCVSKYLEIGCGHGLHLTKALDLFNDAKFDVVDISATSIELSKQVIKHFSTSSEKVSFYNQDILKFDGALYYDLVVINEVIEHLEDPLSMLKHLSTLIGDTGFIFLTTCANAPSIDHIYLYDSVESIQQHIYDAGLEIISERFFSVGDEPRELWIEKNVEINYGALCKNNKEQ